MRHVRALRLVLPLLLAAALGTTSSEAAGKPKRRATGAAYRAHVKKWHTRDTLAKAPLDEQGRPKLVLENVNDLTRVELVASSDQGEFAETERARAASALGGASDPALLDLLYALQRRFDAPCVRVVSAYRPGGSSEHARGRAADIVIPGVEDRTLASMARSLGGTGVGLYPKSGFVHVDVRERPHYWIDTSGPGEPSRARHERARPKAPKKKKKR